MAIVDPPAPLSSDYQAYLCSMYEHDCHCLALTFDEWAATVTA